jgi:hypothetical protein
MMYGWIDLHSNNSMIKASVGPMLDLDGCLARSAMRTQPSIEETGAV